MSQVFFSLLFWMLSWTNNYIAGMHTFDYEQFQHTFLQNTSVKKLCLKVLQDWTRGAYFKTEGEEKLLKHMAMETMFGDFYIAETSFWSHFIT